MANFLDRERSVAHPGFSRWFVPPAALAIHLSIGQVYAFSVFKNPLLALHAADGAAWNLKQIGYIFSLAIAVLGVSAALFGAWLEKAGPRKAMFYAAICFGLGFQIASFGAAQHSLALIYFGYGVVGGVGLGLGYISPVSTLIKWFPDRPGLSTGLAIMGFGGGALIGAPLGNNLMAYFKAHGDANPIPHTWIAMGAIYFVLMMYAAFTIRVPAPGWKPEGYVPKQSTNALISTHNVAVEQAWKTPQFWLLWIVLCMNVTAGIGILEQAAPMIQDFFKGQISPVAATGFVGLLSLFNMAGRFLWASVSDFIGRKATYFCFFILGPLMFFFLPFTGSNHMNSVVVFATLACVALSMYGGGFATIPAYLKDLFGGYNVSAIHGRLLTAWSTAGIIGPLIVNGILDHYKATGQNRLDGYRLELHIMVALLLIGFVANLLVRPVAEKYWMKDAPNTPAPAGH
ncbi:OFA family MFS transporter [Granulicella cerasi]|uniref:OFA family MFS transporter n=1 Tax=Granulicella cerasi TaxID=741063 RepID=A0ABW1ZAX2_9BACT|nr:OFA family MFS transporter [Granulicella cerasi]